MSIIVKPNCTGSIGGGSNKGFPPENITIIITATNDKNVWVKWIDPEDTVLNGVVISKWKGTILVRNDNHYPESIKDGTIVIDNTEKNKYKDTWFKDSGLTNGTTYYYRFFTYNTEYAYSTESNEHTIFKGIPTSFTSVLSNNTWAQIDSASRSEMAQTLWNVGDEIDIDLDLEQPYESPPNTLQIWDFNHFDKMDGSGKAGIVFGCKQLIYGYSAPMNSNGVNTGGWGDSELRNITMQTIYNALPSDLKSVIKEVYTITSVEGDSNGLKTVTTQDKVFIPSVGEVDLNFQDVDGPPFPIFTDNKSRKKYDMIFDNTIRYPGWWTRTPDHGSYYWHSVESDGTLLQMNNPSYYGGVCFCFCI